MSIESFTLNDPLYERSISILVGGSEEQLYEYLKKRHGTPLEMFNKNDLIEEGPDMYNDACQFNVKDGLEQVFYVWLIDRDIKLLHHEMQHLTFDIMEAVGFTYCDESEEAYTYYGAHLFEQAFQKLWPGIKI